MGRESTKENSHLFFSIDEEGAVLGTIIADPVKYFPVARARLTAEDFFDPNNQTIFKLMLELSSGNGDGFDHTLLVSRLKDQPLNQDLIRCMDGILEDRVLAGNFQAHIDQVIDLSERRRLNAICQTIPKALVTGVPVEDAIHDNKALLTELQYSIGARRADKPKILTAQDLLSTIYEDKPAIIGNGIMPYNSQVLISGPSGVGKSMMRLELALYLTQGWKWLGFDVPEKKVVGIIQYENSERIEKARLNRMRYALGIERPQIRFWVDRSDRVNLTLKGDRNKLKERVREMEVEVVFYDCLTNFHATDENKNVDLRQVLDTFTAIDAELGTSSFLFHHFNKASPNELRDPRDRIRGGVTLVDWAVTAITITPRRHEHRHLFQLDFVKIRDGPQLRPIVVERNKDFLFEIAEEDSLCSPTKVKEILISEHDGKVDKQKALIQSLRKVIGCSERSAQTYIQRSVEMGTIKEIDRGTGKAKGYEV